MSIDNTLKQQEFKPKMDLDGEDPLAPDRMIEGSNDFSTAYLYQSNRHLQNLHSNKQITDRKVVLCLTASFDLIFFGERPEITRNPTENETVVVYEEISSVSDIDRITKKMKDQNNKITGIILNAHGAENFIQLNNDKSVKDRVLTNIEIHTSSGVLEKNTNALEDSFKRLEPNGVVILASCLAGNFLNAVEGTCIADTLSNIVPGIKIIAATEKIASPHFVFDKENLHHTVFSKATEIDGIRKNVTETYLRHPLPVKKVEIQELSSPPAPSKLSYHNTAVLYGIASVACVSLSLIMAQVLL